MNWICKGRLYITKCYDMDVSANCTIIPITQIDAGILFFQSDLTLPKGEGFWYELHFEFGTERFVLQGILDRTANTYQFKLKNGNRQWQAIMKRLHYINKYKQTQQSYQFVQRASKDKALFLTQDVLN